MNTLEETLQRLGTAITAAPPLAVTPATPPPVPAISEKRLSASVTKPTPQPLEWDQMPLRDSKQAQDELTRLLYQTFACQRSYGDRAEMMEYRDGMFQLILCDYPFSQVREAFLQHVRTNPNLPTPSDIVSIINPPTPKLSAAVYTQLQKRSEDGGYLTKDERDFCRAFEAQQVARTLHKAG